MRASVIVVFAAGCGSYWDLREGESINSVCDSLLVYYPDADGDGWGDGVADGVEQCGPEGERTASNGLDCDDSDPAIGIALELCAQEIAGGVGVVGAARAGFEYAAVLPPGTMTTGIEADAECARWAGTASEGAALGNRGLVILEDPAELTDLDALLGGGDWVYVGIGWDSTAEDWRWLNGTPIMGALPYCGNVAPELVDANPTLLQGILTDEDEQTLAEQTRLAVRAEGNGYCVGLADEQIRVVDDREVRERLAYFVCERPAPDPTDYVQVPVSPGE